MDRIKYLLKNIGFLTLSQFGTKLLSFFLVPLYTSILTTAEYGTYDLFNTTIILLIPILTLNIKESSIRFALEQQYDKKEVFSISLIYCVKSIVYAMLLLIINLIFRFSKSVIDYQWLILLLFIINAFNGMICNFARGLERIRDIAISSIVCSSTIIILNIIMLIPLHMGLLGYFLANSLGLLVQSFFLFIRIKGWNYIKIIQINKSLKQEMINYSCPLIANAIAWWINSASDRFIIIWVCGIAANGIYSVANKIPSILDIFQNIFNQAWTLSAIKEFGAEDTDKFMSAMFNVYNLGMTCICSALIILSRIFAKFLYAKDFFMAWQYVPFLLIAVLFGSLSGYTGGIFSAAKAPTIFAYSTIIGAIVNIILNFILVRKMGPLGAAIATAICYYLIYIIRMINVKRFVKLNINHKRNYFIYFLLFMQSILLLVFREEDILLYIIEFLLFVFIIMLFVPQLKHLMIFVKK